MLIVRVQNNPVFVVGPLMVTAPLKGPSRPAIAEIKNDVNTDFSKIEFGGLLCLQAQVWKMKSQLPDA